MARRLQAAIGLVALAGGLTAAAHGAGPSSFSGSPSSSFQGSGTVGSGEGDDGGGFGLASASRSGALSGLSVAAVLQLQTELARLGFFHHAVTGYYGPVTTAAVKQFQQTAGLKADGIWGPRSAAALARRLRG